MNVNTCTVYLKRLSSKKINLISFFVHFSLFFDHFLMVQIRAMEMIKECKDERRRQWLMMTTATKYVAF